jgi:hypothetical protein
MSSYRVAFMKKLCSSSGHQFDCVQDEFHLDSTSPEEARTAAIERFRRLHGMQDWRVFADRVEVKALEAAA